MKTCFKCGENKPFIEFYRHSQMADGHLNKCKECTKRDTRANRATRCDYYNAYDRARRQALSIEVRQRLNSQRNQKYTQRYPEKRKAQHMASNAIRDGRLQRQPCEICGAMPAEAHHDDYSKPLSVRWLCIRHHGETRRKPF